MSLPVFLLAIVAAGCQSPRHNVARVPVRAPIAVADHVRVRVAGAILTVPLEEYVLGSALSEVSPTNESADVATRIFAVQAVIARTYAVSHLDRHRAEGFDLCDDTHCQLYQPSRIDRSVFTAVARQAVTETSGLVVAYGGRPALTAYHADCGGHTADAASVWGGRVPYLLGGIDDVPEATHRTWTFTASLEGLGEALNAETDTRVGAVRTVQVAEREESGRAWLVEVGGHEIRRIRGERLRTVVNQHFGPRAILSSRFRVTLLGDRVRFDGTGYGHGVGLCQVGAAARARRGESLERILSAYFDGAELAQTNGRANPAISRPAEPEPRRPLPFPAAR
jgi:stage II sporulation protein D